MTLKTYTGLFNNANIYFRDQNYSLNTDLSIQFTGMTSIDSVIVPDGLTFAQPQVDNNYTGQYRVLHTGQFWCRLLVNGEDQWRYTYFDNVSSTSLDTTLDVLSLPQIPGPLGTLDLPLLAAWDYQVEQVLDLDDQRFLAIGDLLRAPGGAIPVFDELAVFAPPGGTNAGYRIRFSGNDSGPGGYGYTCDRFFADLPTALEAPDFDIAATGVVNERWITVQCSGFIDLLSISRTCSGTPNITWEALLAPDNSGGNTYRLPDIPSEIATLLPKLANYGFDAGVSVRAESYESLNVYPEVIGRMMRQDDPLWQMKAGYIARERRF